MKKNASFFWFLLGKERGRIVPGCPRIVVAREIRERPRKSFITDSESYFFVFFACFVGLDNFDFH